MKMEGTKFPCNTTLLVLALLEDGEKCGYQMIRELENHSDKTFLQNEGALYPILHELERQGDVKSCERGADLHRVRKYYRLTRQGVRTLRRKRKEWERDCAKNGKGIGGEVYGAF